jgi:hypothetical protein
MNDALLITAAALVSFSAHDLFESILGRHKHHFVIKIRGYHLHHSFFGMLIAVVGLAYASGIIALICCGYGLGNIWQHKIAHNRVAEKGMVFITKAS